MNGSKDEGAKEFRKDRAVRGFPTVLILKPDGTEVDRIVGFGGDGDAYMDKLNAYAAGEGTFLALSEKLEGNPDDLTLQVAMAQKRVDRYEYDLAKPHFEKVLELDPENESGHAEEATFYIALVDARAGQIDDLKAILAETENESYLKMGYSQLIRYYMQNEQPDQVVEVFEALLTQSPEDTGLMNQYAWVVYENKWADHYDRAIEVAKRAVDLKPDAAHIWDTLAWLYAENGDKEKAIASMEKAVELDPQFGEALEKIKGGEA